MTQVVEAKRPKLRRLLRRLVPAPERRAVEVAVLGKEQRIVVARVVVTLKQPREHGGELRDHRHRPAPIALRRPAASDGIDRAE
jgi:hypothetical protein